MYPLQLQHLFRSLRSRNNVVPLTDKTVVPPLPLCKRWGLPLCQRWCYPEVAKSNLLHAAAPLIFTFKIDIYLFICLFIQSFFNYSINQFM